MGITGLVDLDLHSCHVHALWELAGELRATSPRGATHASAARPGGLRDVLLMMNLERENVDLMIKAAGPYLISMKHDGIVLRDAPHEVKDGGCGFHALAGASHRVPEVSTEIYGLCSRKGSRVRLGR